jgi:hypothetical protein
VNLAIAVRALDRFICFMWSSVVKFCSQLCELYFHVIATVNFSTLDIPAQGVALTQKTSSFADVEDTRVHNKHRADLQCHIIKLKSIINGSQTVVSYNFKADTFSTY